MRIRAIGFSALFLIVWWVHGLAVAKGFWMTFFCLFPIVSWVVSTSWIIERFSQ